MKHTFNDDQLQQVAETAIEKIANFPKDLDKVSQDIKALEVLLSQSGVCVNYWVEMECEDPLDIRCIGWDKIDGKWRIWHHSSSYESGGNRKRPLIEMPAHDRLHAAPYLAELLRSIAELVPDTQLI